MHFLSSGPEMDHFGRPPWPDSVERAQTVAVVSLMRSREHAERVSFIRFCLKFGATRGQVHAAQHGPLAYTSTPAQPNFKQNLMKLTRGASSQGRLRPRTATAGARSTDSVHSSRPKWSISGPADKKGTFKAWRLTRRIWPLSFRI